MGPITVRDREDVLESALERILAPVSSATFVADYWEEAPLAIQRGAPDFYRQLLSLGDVDVLLTESHPSWIQVVKDGVETPLTGHAGWLEIGYEQYRRGSTFVLRAVHERWRPLRELCRDLGAEFSARFQINAYLTPRNAQGFAFHYDTHDVFVLQTEGTKHWRVFDSSMTLPFPSEAQQEFKSPDSEPLLELDLAAGDLLYIPRGFPHEATSGESTSLHLTVGILPVTWAEVLLTEIEAVLEDSVAFRSSLPFGFARDSDVRAQAEARLHELTEIIANQVSPDRAVTNAVDRLIAGGSELDGHLLDLEALPFIGSETTFRRRQDVQWRTVVDDDSVSVHLGGKIVRMPRRVERDVRYMEDGRDFTLSQLPGALDEEGRAVLTRRLVREGFLTIVR